MKRLIVCLSVVLVFASCATGGGSPSRTTLDGAVDFRTTAYSSFLDTRPAGGAPVFFAAVQRMSDREEEFDACLAAAAQQASRFIAAQASSYFIVQENNKNLLYLEGLEVQYDTALAEELMADLTVIRELQDRDGSYILARLEGHSVGPIPYNPSAAGGMPSWVRDFPSIPGYYVGVGLSQRAGRFGASIQDADDRAMEEIIRQISVSQFTDRRDIEVDTVGSAFVQKRKEISEAVVLGFYVIHRWISPDGSSYYSLAVCPRDKNTRPQ